MYYIMLHMLYNVVLADTLYMHTCIYINTWVSVLVHQFLFHDGMIFRSTDLVLAPFQGEVVLSLSFYH